MSKLKCLVVDDDRSKCDRLIRTLEMELGEDGFEVETRNSASTGAATLRERHFDLLIIDLNLPQRPNETPLSDGGLRLLRQIARGTGTLKRPLFILGLTAFDNLAEEASSEFHAHGWTLVRYSIESTAWEEVVVNQCKHITDCKTIIQDQHTSSRSDVCIITALHNVELEAVLDLPVGFQGFADLGDSTRYSRGVLTASQKSLSIVACAATEMGNASSAAFATKVISKFRPKVCFMAGICAGIDADIGDICIAEGALHYESGKWTQTKSGDAVFNPQPRYQPASDSLLEAVRRFAVDRQDKVLSLPTAWRGEKPLRPPSLRIGPVASGASVIENESIVRDLVYRDRKLVALEMESYGFYLAARNCIDPKPQFIMIKGACDKASPPKTDGFQKYSAFLSAQFIYNFLAEEIGFAGGFFQQ